MKPSSVRLDGIWQVCSQSLECRDESGMKRVKDERRRWMDARVPGEIHLDLIRAGEMKEPLESTHAAESRWPETRSWWYRRTFRVSQSFLRHESQRLIFEGIDLYGQIFLNDHLLGESRNALVPTSFDVRGFLKKGVNSLWVRVTVGTELSPDPPDDRLTKASEDPMAGKQTWPGRRWLRKPQFTYGWDWVDAVPNIGLCRSIRLEGRSWAVLEDVRLDTVLEDGEVFLKGEIVVENLHPWSSRSCRLTFCFRSPRGKTVCWETEWDAQVGRQPVRFRLPVSTPQLWWPNGMGEPSLYQVEVSLSEGGAVCDSREFSYGLRTVSIDQTSLKEGRRFCIQVNGQDVFCKGGNWIPADAILARVTEKKLRALVDAAADANLNMLRVWGGGVYEDEAFYEACDQRGVLVWQDFLFACSQYPDHDPAFCAEVRREAELAVKRLRHHACIALWSGNNENVWGFADWWNPGKEGFDRDVSLGGKVLYNQILPEVCRVLDPGRPYWPGSPFGGERPNDETSGDCHWWHPGTMNPDVQRRIRHEIYDECRSRFNSEYGVIGPCAMESMKQYLEPGELKVDSRAFQVHTNWFEKGTTPEAIRYHYADPEGLALREYIRYGQMFQSCLYGRSAEAMRFRKHDPVDDCEGVLIWMYSDCWGETGWTIIDYYLRRKASYYGLKRACEPLRALVRQRKGDWVTRVVNDTLRDEKVTLHRGWMRLDGTECRIQSRRITVPANGMLQAGVASVPRSSDFSASQWFYAAWLSWNGISTDASTWFLLPYRELDLSPPLIDVERRDRVLTLTSPVYCHGVHARDAGRPVLSDNFFDLIPGIPKTVHLLKGASAKGLSFKAILPQRKR